MGYLEDKRTALLMNANLGGRLPNEYQEVEYIESSDGAYIDTNYIPTVDSIVKFDYQFLSGGRFGTDYNYNPQFIIQKNTRNWRCFLGIYGSGNVGTSDFNRHFFEIKDNSFYVDDILLWQGGNYNYSQLNTLYLCSTHHSAGSAYTHTARVYNVIATVGGIKELDLVPCYRKSDNEVGLYDLVNWVFYTNSGSGTFTKGNDV